MPADVRAVMEDDRRWETHSGRRGTVCYGVGCISQWNSSPRGSQPHRFRHRARMRVIRRKSHSGDRTGLAGVGGYSLFEKAILKVGGQTGRACLTRGNVGGSPKPGNRIVETALRGWGGRIRTLGSREAASRAWLDRNGGAIGAPYSLQNGLNWGASNSLAAQPGKVSDR
jgi:hypothetical protein